MCHNPYFNRWFSAMLLLKLKSVLRIGHNPYFNRWFSAINKVIIDKKHKIKVTILILIDGFLQYIKINGKEVNMTVSQSLF